MPVATERFRTKFLSGDYSKVAEGLGGYSEKVENPADIIPAIQRAQKGDRGRANRLCLKSSRAKKLTFRREFSRSGCEE